MAKVLNYILGGLVIVLLVMGAIFWAKSIKQENRAIRAESALLACQNAPVKVDTIHDTIRIVVREWLHPKPKPNDNIPVSVSVPCDSIENSFYSETFSEKGVRIHYEAITACDNKKAILSSIRFPEIVIPENTIIKTKTVHDTIPKEVPASIKSSFLVYGGVTGNSIKVFPGVELGLGYAHRNDWSVTAGALYLTPENKAYLNFRFTFNFHK